MQVSFSGKIRTLIIIAMSFSDTLLSDSQYNLRNSNVCRKCILSSAFAIPQSTISLLRTRI
jgi:hypothetical protein